LILVKTGPSASWSSLSVRFLERAFNSRQSWAAQGDDRCRLLRAVTRQAKQNWRFSRVRGIQLRTGWPFNREADRVHGPYSRA
jgi:hypothetical protein